MNPPNKCPHCGADRVNPPPSADVVRFKCGSVISADFYRSDSCRESAARQKAEKELAEMTHDCEKYRARYKQESDDLAKARYEHAVTLKKLDSSEKELTAIKRRLSGELSDNCPICAKVSMGGHSQAAPMCILCCLESDRDSALLKLEQWRLTAKALWRGVMANDDVELLQSAMIKATELIESEKPAVNAAKEKGTK
ncbi:MAG: hypothetical protein IT581_12205 [Verrucomicrobiales bacterium]|nr:hypothetical protein [Verrucomicrobiales bacterium]